MCIYIYIYMCAYIYIYTYVECLYAILLHALTCQMHYVHRSLPLSLFMQICALWHTPNLPTNIVDFGGFDSNIILI